MAAYVTLDYFKNRAGIKSTTEDIRLQAILDEASQAVADYCGRIFLQGTYTEYLNGTNTPSIFLRQTPVTVVTSVHLDSSGYFGDNPDGAYASSTLLTVGRDYSIPWDGKLGDQSETADATRCCKSGILKRIGSVWPGRLAYGSGLTGQLIPGLGNIEVVYTAGWTQDTMPMTLRGAVCDIAATIKRGAAFGGMLNSESWQGYSYSLADPTMGGKYPKLGSLPQKLNRYRRVV